MFQGTGRLIYDPPAELKSAPWWILLKTDEELMKYYQYWIKKRHAVEFQKTIWGSHISVNRGDTPSNMEAWQKYSKHKIQFTYNNQIYRTHWFYCIPVKSPELEQIRVELGLPPRPRTGFHLTIGRINKPILENTNKERSKYLRV